MGFAIINHPFWGTPIYGNSMKLLYPLIRIHCCFGALHWAPIELAQAKLGKGKQKLSVSWTNTGWCVRIENPEVNFYYTMWRVLWFVVDEYSWYLYLISISHIYIYI
jgi:hypothetical protein